MTRELNISLQPIEFGNFTGINNISDKLELKPEELESALNIDLDSQGKSTRRNGYTKVYP